MNLADRGILPQYEQQLDVAFGEDFALVIGGPGTGKTQWLATKVAALLLRPGVVPETIACLTVRDESAEVLRRQLETNPMTRGHAGRFFVGTINQCANRLLRTAGHQVLGMRPDHSIWGEDQAVEMLWMALTDHPDLQVARREALDILRWHWRNQRRWPDDPPEAPREGHWMAVVEAYITEKRRQNALDLYDLPVLAVLAMDRDPALMAARNQDCFQHVLVDGAEELTPRQVAFLERIVGQSGSLVVTADPSQAISAEADQSALTYLLEAWPAMRVYHLRASHQTTRRLARVAATLRGDLDGTPTPEVIPDPDSPGGEDPKLVLVEGILQDMDVHCLNELWRLHQEGVAWEDMAVLDRRGRAIGRMQTQLLHRGIPHRTLGVPVGRRSTDARCVAAFLTGLVNPLDLQAMRLAAASSYLNQERILPAAISRRVRWVAREQGVDLATAAEQVRDSLPAKSRDRRSLHMWCFLHKFIGNYLSRPDMDLTRLCASAGGAVIAAKAEGLTEPKEMEMARLVDLGTATPPLPNESRRAHVRRFLDRWSEVLHPARGPASGPSL